MTDPPEHTMPHQEQIKSMLLDALDRIPSERVAFVTSQLADASMRAQVMTSSKPTKRLASS